MKRKNGKQQITQYSTESAAGSQAQASLGSGSALAAA
jgi:hypothetical protein